MIRRLLRPVRPRIAAAGGLGALAAACAVGLMATSAWLLSRAAEHPPVLYLMVAVVGVRALGLGRAVFGYLGRLVGHDVALRLQAALREQAYAALARSTWLGRRGGDLLSRLVSDVGASQDLVVRAVLPLLSAGVVVAGTGTLLGLLLPAAGLVVAGASAAAAVVIPALVGWSAARTDRRLAPLRGGLAAAVAEADAAAVDLLLHDASHLAADRVAAADTALCRAERRAAFLAGLAGATQLAVTGAAVAGALVVGARAVADQTLSPVLLAVLVLTPLALHEVMAAVPPAVQAWTRSAAALARVAELIAAPPTGAGELDAAGPSAPSGGAGPAGAAGRGSLSLHDLTAGWPGHPPVVRHLDLEVRAGEWVGLVGPSGVGKTTVAATVLGLLEPVAGTVEVRGPVGYLAQDAHVFDTTVAENVAIGRRGADAADVAAALARARLPLDPNRRVGANGDRLSGGEARRLAFSRLLLRADPVVILDEPTEHVDRLTAAALVDDLWARTRGRAVLVITHDPELVARCDRVVELAGRAR